MRKIYLWDGHNGAVSFRVFNVTCIHVGTTRRAEDGHTFETLLRVIKTVGMTNVHTAA